MRVRIAGETRTGRAIDLREYDFAVTEIADAIRGEGAASAVSIDCPAPGPAHARVGAIRAGMAWSRRPALAAAARSRGHTAPQADELAEVRDRLDAIDAPTIDLRAARRRVAETGDAAEELREEVATVRGRVRALREAEADAADAEADLADATRRLSEVETERIAAEQTLARAREQARTDRERRRERLRLEDRAENLRRSAREALADEVRSRFEDALAALPDDGALPEPVGAALAVARVADLDAPVAVARVGPFEGVDAISAWLDAPVVRV
ncbi:hypothetical protein M0R88_07665 [Halorussus gelatinilyticus]|uniref:Uncharacterized protein n=1 Tax=Halorussus gelatinilyticus TaxID=2937524 RepID=A0A8U0IND7_9EURY|nr:hypothetical protein [Halorussus gelatinilyticus]UPW01962.1 hypothetical protein M0R88_07665 [Halorussus gelatinilyticus]